jgi:hypothetical protein
MDEGTHGTIAGGANPAKSTGGCVTPVMVDVLQCLDQWSYGVYVAKPLKNQCCLPELDF